MSNPIFLDEFGIYCGKGFAKLANQTRGLNKIELINELISNAKKKNDLHSAIIEVLHDNLFKHFSDDNIQQLFDNAGIHINNWHYYYQASIPWANAVRISAFATNHIHNGDIFKAIQSYEQPISDMLVSVLSD